MTRRAAFIAATLAGLWLTPVFAQDSPPPAEITVAQAIQMLSAIQNLDGHQVVVRQNGQETVVLEPWKFSNGALRLAIARNAAALSAVQVANETTRLAIIKEIFKGAEPRDGTPEMTEFTRQMQEMLRRPANVTLERIKAKDLRLDVNEIGISTLVALDPILER